MGYGNNNEEMDGSVRKHIAVSAVNIRKGGTLTVLRDCLAYLSARKDLKVTALVHSRDLCDFPGIEYIEIPWSAKGWGRRLWCEYVTMGRLSRKMGDIDLWLSLHDTTPNVRARRRAVYCHTSFPFMKIKARDFRMDFKIPLFAMLTRFAYRINVHENDYLIVQQDWFRKGLSKMLGFPEERIIVARPDFKAPAIENDTPDLPTFLYPATPDCHKNFETLCEASSILEQRIGKGKFRTVITIDGRENRYSRWIFKKWNGIGSIEFHGFMGKDELYSHYGKASCLVFPSRVETWGLPVSEFMPSGKPIAIADLPYAHETVAGAGSVAFFDADDAAALADLMQQVVEGNLAGFSPVPRNTVAEPSAENWKDLLNLLEI